jgi:hypothetical protein
MVLVDAPSENTLDQIPNLARRKFPISLPRHALSLVVEGVGQTGVLRLGGSSPGPHPPGFTQEQWTVLSALQRNPRAIAAEINEQGAGLQSVARVRASGGLGDMPLIVLTAGQGPDIEEQRTMIRLQGEFAHRFPRGNQVLVSDSDHMIHTTHQKPSSKLHALSWPRLKRFPNRIRIGTVEFCSLDQRLPPLGTSRCVRSTSRGGTRKVENG